MKFGCTVYVFAMKPGPGISPMLNLKALDYVDAIKQAAKLGFKGASCIIQTKDMDDSAILKLKETAESFHMTIVELVGLFGDSRLSDEDTKVRQEGIRAFEESAQVASKLGAKVLNIQSQDPFPYKRNPVAMWKDVIIKVDIPTGFNWKRVWDTYVQTIGRCVDIAHDEGVLLAMERHPFQIVDNTNMDLKLIEDVGSESLGVCYDTAQVLMAVEIPALSIYKLKDRIFHTHLSDNLGSFSRPRHLMPGRGQMDWDVILKALKDVGYDYFLSLEIQTPTETLDEEYRRGMAFLKSVADKQNIKIE
jgi:sugar phosphate isomerase/epimerase